MAQYTVRHTCGHTVTVNLFGKHTGRNETVSRMETRPCSDCRKAAEGAAAMESNQQRGLPPLMGTQKQIAWAEKIRAEALASPKNAVLTVPPGDTAKAAAALNLSEDEFMRRISMVVASSQEAYATLCGQTNASWWIDSRETVGQFVSTAAEAAKASMPPIPPTPEVIAAEAAAKARKAAEQEAAEQARLTRQTEEAEQRQKDKAVSASALENFVPVKVEMTSGDGFQVFSEDGRTAKGAIDGGEWFLYQIGETPVSGPVADKIAETARRLKDAG